MLANDFYSIINANKDAGQYSALLRLNADHAILKGHFPGNPIVPGVCMVQILKELAEGSIGKSLQLDNAPMIKFLALLQPTQHPEILASVQYNEQPDGLWQVSGQLTSSELTFIKFKGVFHEQ